MWSHNGARRNAGQVMGAQVFGGERIPDRAARSALDAPVLLVPGAVRGGLPARSSVIGPSTEKQPWSWSVTTRKNGTGRLGRFGLGHWGESSPGYACDKGLYHM
jgi:hypothetical protein